MFSKDLLNQCGKQNEATENLETWMELGPIDYFSFFMHALNKRDF